MIEVIGKEGITARVICDSIGLNKKRLTTFEIEYPRFIHSELMTHKMLSKNCASSRAIPVKTILEQIRNNPAMPVWWGKNQPGMSALEEIDEVTRESAEQLWRSAASVAAMMAEDILNETGLHKQITNRITETWQRMKTVISGTDWENLWWLRDHDAAQPEFHELARVMRQALVDSKPNYLKVGEWHLPYVNTYFEVLGNDSEATQMFNDSDNNIISLEQAQHISASCCAQVSYRKNDDSLEKAEDIFAKLIGADRKHYSPLEHLGTPIAPSDSFPHPRDWSEGVTHMDKFGSLWSGNFRGWVQYRQLIMIRYGEDAFSTRDSDRVQATIHQKSY